MQKLYYQFPGTWFGDCMPFGHGDKFYLYHQRDTRKPGPFGEPFGWDLATTSDFVHYEDKGVAIPRGTDEEQDQCCRIRLFRSAEKGKRAFKIRIWLMVRDGCQPYFFQFMPRIKR